MNKIKIILNELLKFVLTLVGCFITIWVVMSLENILDYFGIQNLYTNIFLIGLLLSFLWIKRKTFNCSFFIKYRTSFIAVLLAVIGCIWLYYAIIKEILETKGPVGPL